MVKVFIVTVILFFSSEVQVSGMSTGGIGTKWYSLAVLGGIRISPARGSEEAIYNQQQEEGEAFERALDPLKEAIEKIILEAKEKMNAPIVIYSAEKDKGYIGGIIIEDEIEFDASFITPYENEKQIAETIAYEQEEYQSVVKERAAMTSHFEWGFVEGSHITVSFERLFYNDGRYYQMSFTVNKRINRSTLNWIRTQIDPLIREALQIK